MPGARGSGRGGARDRERNADGRDRDHDRGNEGGNKGGRGGSKFQGRETRGGSAGRHGTRDFADRPQVGDGGRGNEGRRGGSLLGGLLTELVTPKDPLRAPGYDDPGIVGTVAGLAGGPLIGGALALGTAASKAARDAGLEVTPYGRSRVGRLDRGEHQGRGGAGDGGGADRSVLDPRTPDVPAAPKPVAPPVAGDPSDIGRRGRRRRQGTLLSGNLGRSRLTPLG